MGISTYSDIDAFVNPILETALAVARFQNIMSSLVLTFGDAKGLTPRTGSEYSALTAATIGETDDLTPTTYSPSALSTLTPGEVGLQVLLTDSRIDSDPNGVRADASQEIGLAIGDKVDTDLLGDFSSFTGVAGGLGSAGTAITWGYFFALLTRLRATKAPPPYVVVMHDYQWHVLAKATSVAATTVRSDAPAFVDDVMRRWYVGQVADAAIFATGNISIDANDDAYVGAFSRSALALDVRRALRLEPERDASRRAWEINATMIYAHGVWRPAFGVYGLFDATAPTS